MGNDFEQLSIDTLITIKKFGIKSKTVINVFKHSCCLLKIYLEKSDLDFSIENGQKWLASIYPEKPMTHSKYCLYMSRRRVVFLLWEYQTGKLDSWRTYPQKKGARPKTSEYLQLIQIHENKLYLEGMAKETIYFSMHVDSDFLIYLERLGKFKINNIMPQDVSGYFAQNSFYGRKPDGVKAYAYKLKLFLTFLEETGILTKNKLSLAVPKVFAKQESIVTVLSEKAVLSLVNGDNKGNSETYIRDHAMILLALRLGIRRSDIIKMKLKDIDWKNDSISFIQQKTGVPINLPLLSDVGNALMDYILNFRPKIISEFIFLKHKAPYGLLKPNRMIIKKYLNTFDSNDCPQRGFHILRRTLASKMLRNNIARSIISASIGQVDVNSVDVYLSVDEEKMRECAISMKGIECIREDLR